MDGEGAAHRHAVLVVEDDGYTRAAVRGVASSAGFAVVVVDNTHFALQVLRGGLRPCVIVLDMAMPDMDGYAFRREQLADPALADIPVVVMTGGGSAVEAAAQKLGLTVFLRKPVDPETLLKAMRDHCGGRPK